MPDGLLGSTARRRASSESILTRWKSPSSSRESRPKLSTCERRPCWPSLAQPCLGPVEEAKAAYGIPDGISGHAQQDQALNVAGAPRVQ